MKDNKHDHKGTKLLKLVIFSSMMLLPLMSVGASTLYTICNKNAYLNYSGRRTDQYQSINYLSMKANTEYHFQSTLANANDYTYTQTSDIYISDVHNVIGVSNDLSSVNRLRPYKSGTIVYIAMYHNDTNIIYFRAEQQTIQFDFTFESASYYQTNGTVNLFDGWIYEITNSYNNYMDNALDYAYTELPNKQYMAWCDNTGIYTGINAMMTGLDVQDTTIVYLLTYWTMLTAVYIVFDIVIETFTRITHLIGEK